jgi:TolB protein
MNADGTSQSAITTHTAEDTDPAWSPGGEKIAFSSKRSGTYQIYVMGSDGSQQTRLTKNSGNDFHPCFSPEGERIAFDSNRDDAVNKKTQIYS